MIDLPPFEQAAKSGLWVPSRPAIIRPVESVKPIIPAGMIMVVNGWLKQAAAASAPSFFAAGTAAFDANEGGTNNCSFPASLAAGDLLFACGAGDDIPFIGFEPQGGGTWTKIGQSANSGFGVSVWWCVWNGSSSSTSLDANTASNGALVGGGFVFAVRGADTSDPIEGPQDSSGSGTSMTADAVTTSGANRLVCFFGGVGGAGASTPASGWDERVDTGSTLGSDMQLTLDTKVQAAAGSTGTATRTIASNPWGTVSWAIKPLGG